METDKIITIIVPTYNMEGYLHQCLDSLLIGENFDRMEVLVINDGSKDASSSIAHGYERKYPDIFKVVDKDNGNYGSCINVALGLATGKYVKVLDADDRVERDNFERFVAYLMQTDADLVLSDFAVVDTSGTVRKVIKYRWGAARFFDIKDVCNTDTFKNMQMHAVAYRLEMITLLGYRQTEGISYTDQQWIFEPMVAVDTVAVFDRYVYRYLVGRVGQTVDPAVKLKSVSHTVRCSLGMVAGYERHKQSVTGKPIREYLYDRLIPMVKDVYVFSLCHYGVATKLLLVDFDRELKKASEEIHAYIGSSECSSFMGFGYIDYWRKHKHISPLLIKTMSKLYLAMLKFKQKFHRPSEMAVPTSF